MTMLEPILLAGYSVRMLAELAARAGYGVIALDYFGDSDLRATCRGVSLLRDFAGKAYNPHALVAAARTLEAPSVVYGASFENHPALVAELARGRCLLGNTPETLARVRDPVALGASLRGAGFAFPETRRLERVGEDENLITRRVDQFTPPGGWLWKPERGGGGSGVRWAGRGHGVNGIAQEYVEGLPCSFTFVADGRDAQLIGLSEQLIGLPAFGASGFRWCGNLTPPRAPAGELDAMRREAALIASHLASAFGLRGVNTVDFIWRSGRIWSLEVNARPSASLELFDRLFDLGTFDLHVRGCLGERVLLSPPAAGAAGQNAAGKAVVFAAANARVGDTRDWHARDIRDIPHPGESIARGHPICTVLAYADTSDACLAELHIRAAWVSQQLAFT